MTDILQLVRTYDFRADQTSVDLFTAATDGFETAYEGWVPASSKANRYDRVIETITLRAQGTSTAALANAVQKLAGKAWEADRFTNAPVEEYGVWLRVQLDGETSARQSLVYEVDHGPASAVYSVMMRQGHRLNEYTLGLERAPWWEGTAMGTISASTVACLGGTFAYSGITGDMPARLAAVAVQQYYDATNGTVRIWPNGQMWLGFRGTRFGGTPGAWTAKKAVNADFQVQGSGIRGISSNPAADTLAANPSGTVRTYGLIALNAGMKRLGFYTMGEISGSAPVNMFGSFVVLARMRIFEGSGTALNIGGTGDIYHVRMATGFARDTNEMVESYDDDSTYLNHHYYPRVPVRGGKNWKLYEMGEVVFPPTRRTTMSGIDLNDFSIFLYGERIAQSGTPYLALDTLYFIPTGEGYYYAGRPLEQAYYNPPGSLTIWGYNGPADECTAYIGGTASGRREALAGGDRAYGVAAPYYRPGLTAGTGIVVLAMDANNSGTAATGGAYNNRQYATWKVNVDLWYAPRWQSLRGTA